MTTIKPRTAVVTIYQGDYLDRIRHLEQQHEAAVKAEDGAPRMLSETSRADQIADEHEALVTEAEETAVKVTVQALPRKVWRALVAAHPARDGNRTDAAAGVNEETFKDALVVTHGEVDRFTFSTIVEPELGEDDIDALSDVDFDRLYFSAFALNRAPATGPKALPVSPKNTLSDVTSN